MSLKIRSSVICALVLVIGLNSYVTGHTYHTGQCPTMEPMSGFEMRKFLGVWYAIQKTSTASTCVIYNITRGDEPGEYQVEQTSQHFVLGLTPLKHEYSYTGQLSVNDDAVPAKMTVKFPLSVAGSAGFTIFMTDYDTYAGIFTCQRLAFAHRRSATLLSRERTLDKVYLDKLRSRLASSSVDPFDLSIINQTGCPKDAASGVNIHIDPDTLSSQNIGNAVRKAGEKVGDGVEYVVEAGKKVGGLATDVAYHAYNKFSNNGNQSENLPTPTSNSRSRVINENSNNDAEWVPF